MKKVKLFGVDVNVLVNEYDNYGLDVCDFKKSGVYCIESGSRGEIFDVVFMGESDEIVVKEKEDIIKELMEDNGEDGDLDYFDEFCDGYVEGNYYVEVYGEESYEVYVNVIVE